MKKNPGDIAGHSFDDWQKLAKENPELFEQQRQAVINKVIDEASPHVQERLRGLQWRIDMERKRAKTPLNACLKIYNMMWDRVYGEGGLLESLDTLLHYNQTGAVKSNPKLKQLNQSADVLKFRIEGT